jgi:hypothetical protein
MLLVGYNKATHRHQSLRQTTKQSKKENIKYKRISVAKFNFKQICPLKTVCSKKKKSTNQKQKNMDTIRRTIFFQ